MDKEIRELLDSQRELFTRLEQRFTALEAENAALRERLGKREAGAAAQPGGAANPAAVQAGAPPQPGGYTAGAPAPAQAPGYPSQNPGPTQPGQVPTAAPGQTQPYPTAPGPGYYAQRPGADSASLYTYMQNNPYARQAAPASQPTRPQGASPSFPVPSAAHPGPGTPAPGAPQTAGAPAPGTPSMPGVTGMPAGAPPAYGFVPPPAQATPGKDKGSVESRIGGRITGIVGLVFILVGVVLALRYVYVTYHSDWIILGPAYLLAVVFLAGGHLMNRKNSNAFSLSLLAGGVGIGLATTAAGYFNLHALPALAACGICVLVAALALLLAVHHGSQLIAVFALVGGYMPMLAVDATLATAAKPYLLLLNLLVLFFAMGRDWRVLKCLSLAFNTTALVYLFSIGARTAGIFNLAAGLDLGYLLLCFLVYMAACLLLAVRQKRNLTDLDTVLIGLNTWVHFALAQWVLQRHGVPRVGGVIALALSAGFWLFARASRRFLPRDHSARALFYANSFVLLPLGLALLFRGDVRLYAFLAAGAALWCAGLWAGKQWYARAGGTVFGLGAAQFLFHYGIVENALLSYQRGPAVWPFTLLVVLALAVLATQLLRHHQTVDGMPAPVRELWQAYQTGALAVSCGYLIWLVRPLLLFGGPAQLDAVRLGEWDGLLVGILLFALPHLLWAIKPLRAACTRVLGIVMVCCGLGFTLLGLGFTEYTSPTSLVLLALLYLCALGSVYLVLYRLPGANPLGERWRAPALVLLGLLLLTLYLVVQLDVPFNGLLLSVIYLVAALACILAGFMGLKTVLRRSGLALLYAAITKLFLLDLAFLPYGQRVVSYLVFGFALLGISWVYQHYEKRLQKEEAGPPQP